MRVTRTVCCLASAAMLGRVAALAADPVLELRQAIQALGNKPNYSWVAIPKSETPNASVAPIEGKTEKNGFTYFKLGTPPNMVEVAFYGTKSAIKSDQRWELADELPPERIAVARRLRTFRAPVAEAQDLLGKAGKLTVSRGVFSADLTPTGARDLLLARRAGSTENSDPAATKGWVKFWVKDGMLAKYEYNVQGRMISRQQAQMLDVNLTTSVEIKDAGATVVEVPEEARKKLL